MPLKLHKTINTLNIDLNTKASTESPSFTGTPTAPTAASGDNSSQLATTEFVMQELTGIDNVLGDVVLGYQDKEGYLPCNGSFAFADDYLEFYNPFCYYIFMAWSPSGKATVCKTVIHRFESGPGLHFCKFRNKTVIHRFAPPYGGVKILAQSDDRAVQASKFGNWMLEIRG